MPSPPSTYVIEIFPRLNKLYLCCMTRCCTRRWYEVRNHGTQGTCLSKLCSPLLLGSWQRMERETRKHRTILQKCAYLCCKGASQSAVSRRTEREARSSVARTARHAKHDKHVCQKCHTEHMSVKTVLKCSPFYFSKHYYFKIASLCLH